jgi:glycerol-3-phosphate dehydrogenase
MAEKAVDHLIRMHPALHHATPCTTHHHRIIGSVLPRDTVMSQLQADPQLAPLAEYLYARYGDQSSKIGQYIRAPDDLIPLLHDLPITRAEIRYTLHHEYVRKPLDFLVRRSGAGLIDRQAAYDLLPEVLSVMAETFGWDIPLTSRRETEAKALLNASI